MSVTAHMMMAASAGLFARAIVESHPLGLPFRTQPQGRAFTKVLAKKAGCSGALEACLRALNTSALLAAQKAAQVSQSASQCYTPHSREYSVSGLIRLQTTISTAPNSTDNYQYRQLYRQLPVQTMISTDNYQYRQVSVQ